MGSVVADHFSSHAEQYERYWADVLMPCNRQLVAMLPLADAAAVLEIGAGVGKLARELQAAAPHARIVLSDRAEGMLRRAPGDARVVADASDLPFRSRSFDAVVMAFMLHYVDDPVRALGCVRRVLRPGGAVAIAVWGQTGNTPAEQMWTDALDEFGAPPTVDLGANYAALDSVDKVRDALTSAGFTRVEARPLEFVDHPDGDELVARLVSLGASGRRLAAWDATSRDAFVAAMRPRLAALDPVDFRDDSEALAGIGYA